jgi:uncharacterized protein YjbI with pentapeptide repeats
VQFAGGGFAGTNAVGVDFLDCVFRGSEIDVTNFSLVTFRSSPPDAAHPTLVTPNVAAFENCVILNRRQPPPPKVLDLSDPAEEVRFRDAVFTGVRFRGNVHPEWFEKCSFDRCTFPKAIDLGRLEKSGHHVAECSVADESLD